MRVSRRAFGRALGVASLCLWLAACAPDSAMGVSGGAEVAGPSSAEEEALKYRAVWSADGHRLFDQQLTSPDRRHIFEWTAAGIEVSGVWQGVLAGIHPTTAPELLWSQAGDKVAISWSESGSVGPWHVNVVDLAGDEPVDLHLASRFERPSGCSPSPANVAALSWLDDDVLLLAIERPRDTCMSPVMVTGLRVSLAYGQQGYEIAEDRFYASWRDVFGPRVLRAAELYAAETTR